MQGDRKLSQLPSLARIPHAYAEVKFGRELSIKVSKSVTFEDMGSMMAFLADLSDAEQFYAFEMPHYAYYSRDGRDWRRVKKETPAYSYASTKVLTCNFTVSNAVRWENNYDEIEKKLLNGYVIDKIVFDQDDKKLFMIFRNSPNDWHVRYIEPPNAPNFPELLEESCIQPGVFKEYFKNHWEVKRVIGDPRTDKFIV